MKTVRPQQPSNLSPYARACLDALVSANLADRISLGGALGLFHYLDYRPTHDVDAWWSRPLSEGQKQEVTRTLETTLATFGDVDVRAWGDVVSVELSQNDRAVFSFQIAERSARLEEPVSAGWIDVPLDSLSDLVATKMVALVERGAPRDFLDIYTLCRSGLLNVPDCWELWSRRQTLAGRREATQISHALTWPLKPTWNALLCIALWKRSRIQNNVNRRGSCVIGI